MMSFICWIKTKTFQIQNFFFREIVSFLSSEVFNFRSKNLIFLSLNVWLNIVDSSDEILIWEDEEEFCWFCWFCWFLLIMIIRASNLASSLAFQIFSRLAICKSNSSELPVMLKVEKCSDCDKKRWIVSKVWDLWFASQFMYAEWEARNWVRCKNWVWSIFSFNFSSTIQNDKSKFELTEHSFCLIELSDCSDSWEDENFR